MKNYKEELEKYCEEQMNFKFASENQRKDWIFGAVEFAKRLRLVDEKTAKEIMKKYGIF